MAEIIKKFTKGEFSKKFAIWILSVFAVMVFVGMGLMAFVNPSIGGSLVALIGVIMPIPTATVYKYYSKAEAENILKIGNSTSTFDSTSTVTTDTTIDTVTESTSTQG